MKTKKIQLILMIFALTMIFSADALAQSYAGKWEGSIITNGNFPVPDNWSYDWDFGKWNGTKYRPASLTIELKHITGEKYTGLFKRGTNGGELTVRFDAIISGDQFTGNMEGSAIKGNSRLGGDVELTLREEGGVRYFEGKFRSWNFKFFNGAVALRQTEGGENAKNDDDKKDEKPQGDFAGVETDGEYFLKLGEHFLFVNEAENGIISKKDGDDAERKWKFEAAPEGYGKAFRIVPLKKDDFCLEAASDGSGKVLLVAKEDKAEGEQYWRFEKNGDGVQIVNVKFGGRSLFIDDEDSGSTIIRSRNDAKGSNWKLEKQ